MPCRVIDPTTSPTLAGPESTPGKNSYRGKNHGVPDTARPQWSTPMSPIMMGCQMAVGVLLVLSRFVLFGKEH
jgi:hypothetical protein